MAQIDEAVAMDLPQLTPRSRKGALLKLMQRQLYSLFLDRKGSFALLVCASWILVTFISTMPEVCSLNITLS
jgi:hypothetical protein